MFNCLRTKKLCCAKVRDLARVIVSNQNVQTLDISIIGFLKAPIMKFGSYLCIIPFSCKNVKPRATCLAIRIRWILDKGCFAICLCRTAKGIDMESLKLIRVLNRSPFGKYSITIVRVFPTRAYPKISAIWGCRLLLINVRFKWLREYYILHHFNLALPVTQGARITDLKP